MPKQINCREAGFDCEYQVQSESDDEVLESARQHAEQSHNMDLSIAEVREYVQNV